MLSHDVGVIILLTLLFFAVVAYFYRFNAVCFPVIEGSLYLISAMTIFFDLCSH